MAFGGCVVGQGVVPRRLHMGAATLGDDRHALGLVGRKDVEGPFSHGAEDCPAHVSVAESAGRLLPSVYQVVAEVDYGSGGSRADAVPPAHATAAGRAFYAGGLQSLRRRWQPVWFAPHRVARACLRPVEATEESKVEESEESPAESQAAPAADQGTKGDAGTGQESGHPADVGDGTLAFGLRFTVELAVRAVRQQRTRAHAADDRRTAAGAAAGSRC